LITMILNDKGVKLFQSKPVYKTIFTPELTRDMTNMLRNVADKGTAHELRDIYNLHGMIACKTGTTQEHRDGWFMGYTSQFLAGVWVGADNPAVHFKSIEQGRGAALAMPVWAGFYKRIMKDPSVSYMVNRPFPFKNTIDCEMYREDTFIQKLFQKRNKKSNSTGLEETQKERIKKRKEKKVRQGIFSR
jgi:penicillin-binding protein 1A